MKSLWDFKTREYKNLSNEIKNKEIKIMADTSISDTLTGIGAGLGNFLSAIYLPLGNLILILGIIGGVVAIFMGIAYVVKHAISKV